MRILPPPDVAAGENSPVELVEAPSQGRFYQATFDFCNWPLRPKRNILESA
jgi:hypothetical protein